MCQFPARQLLEYLHEVVLQTDTDDQAKMVYACGFVKSLSDLAAFHEDHANCECWNDALVELGWLERPGPPETFYG